jgi:glucose-1-phosphate adenylyltransferase
MSGQFAPLGAGACLYAGDMAAKKIFGIVLAGGEGKRLMPLTADRAKPAVPFGGQYRLIDFALSNLLNSTLRQIVVLTQYKSHSLDRHVSQTWRLSGLDGSYIASVPAQQRLGKRWFSGSADAILQSLNLLRDEQPDIVAVVGADHVYRMDFHQMIEAHIESGAKASVAAIRQPIGLANQFGVLETDPADPARIKAFLEKPADPVGLPDAPHEVLASMGNYVFDADALIEAVIRDGERPDSNHDMGGDIIPDFVARGEAAVYDFKNNDVPGSTDRDRYYWRDVGTIESFFEAHQDLISTLPVFNLYNHEWPIFSQQLNSPPAKIVRDGRGRLGETIDSIVSLGSVISGAHLERSVLGPWATIGSGAQVVDSVVFERAIIEPDAFVGRAILDKDVVVTAGARIGVDHDRDRERGFTVTDSGITVVGKGVHVVP